MALYTFLFEVANSGIDNFLLFGERDQPPRVDVRVFVFEHAIELLGSFLCQRVSAVWERERGEHGEVSSSWGRV